jgi:hypothetical protein
MGNSDEKLLPERLDALFRILNEVDCVSKLGDEHEPEARTLAYSLLEIEESCRCFIAQLDVLFATDPAHALPEVEALREELRHVLYHIHDSRFLRVIEPFSNER